MEKRLLLTTSNMKNARLVAAAVIGITGGYLMFGNWGAGFVMVVIAGALFGI